MINTYKARLTRARKHAKNGNVEACADELLKANREKEGCSELRKAQWLLEACEKECRRVLGITTPLFAGVEEENTDGPRDHHKLICSECLEEPIVEEDYDRQKETRNGTTAT